MNRRYELSGRQAGKSQRLDDLIARKRPAALDFLGPNYVLADDQPRKDHICAVPAPVPMFLKRQGG